jgi:hypothetical protein
VKRRPPQSALTRSTDGGSDGVEHWGNRLHPQPGQGGWPRWRKRSFPLLPTSRFLESLRILLGAWHRHRSAAPCVLLSSNQSDTTMRHMAGPLLRLAVALAIRLPMHKQAPHLHFCPGDLAGEPLQCAGCQPEGSRRYRPIHAGDRQLARSRRPVRSHGLVTYSRELLNRFGLVSPRQPTMQVQAESAPG